MVSDDDDVVLMMPCPGKGCALVLPLDDLQGQMRHMMSEHPEIVAERRREAARWDGWEQD